MAQASICTIGDEILIGQIVDTNSSAISRKLNSAGIKVTRMLSIGDDRREIINNLTNELENNDIVIVTGGLGPTKDDITKPALAELARSTGWVENKEQLEVVIRILHSRGLDVLDINRAQAMVPDNCKVIVNKLGTAPIMAFHFSDERFGHKTALYSMPGVPYETEGALDDVVSDIVQNFNTIAITHRTVMTYGFAESALSKQISSWEDSLPPDMHLAYLPNPVTGVRLRLSVFGGDSEDNRERMERELHKLKDILGDAIYSMKDDTLQNMIGEMLRSNGKTLSAAESCTGGAISALLTSIPGCSDYYYGSVTSYDNSIKTNVLGVDPAVIEEHGAVSSECVAMMAEGVRKLMKTDYSVATSGIAGPGGGSNDKPVGLVWVAVSSEKQTLTQSFRFRNNRERNIERFASSALNMLRQFIAKELI